MEHSAQPRFERLASQLSVPTFENVRHQTPSIYTADNEATARRQLDLFETEWGERYSMIVRSWRANWEQFTGFLAFPLEVRQLIYATNTIESLNFQLRKVIKTKGAFPTEQAAIKRLYWALMNIERKRIHPVRDWRSALSQLVIFFGEQRVLGVP